MLRSYRNSEWRESMLRGIQGGLDTVMPGVGTVATTEFSDDYGIVRPPVVMAWQLALLGSIAATHWYGGGDATVLDPKYTGSVMLSATIGAAYLYIEKQNKMRRRLKEACETIGRKISLK